MESNNPREVTLDKRSVMAYGNNAGSPFTADGKPVFKHGLPVMVEIPVGFIQKQYCGSHHFQAGDGNHASLRGVEIQRMRVGNVLQMTQP